MTWILVRMLMVSQGRVWREGAKPFGGWRNRKSAAGEEDRGRFIKMLCLASPLVDTVMNSQAHCQGKVLHYTTAQWSLISLGGRHPGGSPDQRIYSGLEVPISLAIQSVQFPLSPSLSSSLSLSLFDITTVCII